MNSMMSPLVAGGTPYPDGAGQPHGSWRVSAQSLRCPEGGPRGVRCVLSACRARSLALGPVRRELVPGVAGRASWGRRDCADTA